MDYIPKNSFLASTIALIFSDGDNGAIIHAGNNTPTSFSKATLTSSFTSEGLFINNVSVTEMLPHTTVSEFIS